MNHIVNHERHEALAEGEENLRVQTAVDFYNEYDKSRPVTRRIDIGEVLRDFTDGVIHETARDAAELIDICDRLNDGLTRTNAMRALTPFLNDTTKLADSDYSHGEYILSIAHDVPVMNDFVSSQITSWRRQLKEIGETELSESLDAPQHHEPKPEEWTADQMPVDVKALADLAKDINIETVLIKSAQILTTLRDQELRLKLTNTDLLRTIAAAESVYAPICETLGFDALAMSLHDETWKIRLTKAGREDILERAEKIRNDAGGPDTVAQAFSGIVDKLIGESDTEAYIKNDSTRHDMFVRDGYVQIPEFDDIIRFTARLKSVGSIARKLLLDDRPEVEPVDILGATIITSDDEEAARVMAHLYNTINNDESAAFCPAPSRDQSLHVKGSAEFIDLVKTTLWQRAHVPEEDIDHKDNGGGYEYAKVTFKTVYLDQFGHGYELPVEIQCLHEDARRESRTGVGAHMLFKLKKYGHLSDEDIAKLASSLKSLAERKRRLVNDQLTINGASYDRQQKQMKRFTESHAYKTILGRLATPKI